MESYILPLSNLFKLVCALEKAGYECSIRISKVTKMDFIVVNQTTASGKTIGFDIFRDDSNPYRVWTISKESNVIDHVTNYIALEPAILNFISKLLH